MSGTTGLRLFSFVPLAIFLAAYFFFAEVSSLRCSRFDGACLLTQDYQLKQLRVPFALSDLLEVQEDRVGKTGRTLLITREGPVQFEVWKTNRPAAIADDVRAFLDHPGQRDLLVTYDTRLGILGHTAFLLVASVLLFAFSLAPAKKR
jgi:hypothetical protein